MHAEDRPWWLPEPAAPETPRRAQAQIIESDPTQYPIRVIAGAGTGKTFTMIRTIEHLIEERDVPASDVLSVTFTNKAADSMQGRLHAKLGQRGYDVTTATYHSICHRLLSEYAYHADLDPEFEIATEAERYLLIVASLDKLTYRFVDPDVHDRGGWGRGVAQKLLAFISAMKRSGIEPEELDSFLGDARGLVDLGSLPEEIEAAADSHLRGTAIDSLPAALCAMVDELEGLRETYVSMGAPGVDQTVDAFFDAMIASCRRMATVYEERSGDLGDGELADAHKLPAFLFGSYSGPPAGIPPVGFTFPDRLGQFIDRCQVARDLTDGYAAYERTLAANELIDFDDAIIKAVELLRTDVGEEIAQQWEYVFCDEFQDTDPLQFELIRELVTDGRLFVVGDDDQAIYGWRGAEVDNIKDHLEDAYAGQLTDKELTENFRSHQPILDLANDALAKLDNRVVEKSLTRFDPPSYGGDAVAIVRAKEEPDGWAMQLRNVITHVLAGDHESLDRAYSPDEIAVLTKKHKHATPIVEALEAAGIPCERDGGSGSDSVGVATVTAYLKALAAPREDEVSINRVLLMRYRLAKEDLERLNREGEHLIDALLDAEPAAFAEPDRVAEAKAQFAALLDVRDRYSVGRLYRELKELTDIEWYLSERERGDLKRLDRFVAGYGDQAFQPSLDGTFVELLEEQDDIESRAEGRATEQAEFSQEAVNVTTIFRAKGLDFPVVIIPELDADEWAPRRRRYDALNAAIKDGHTEPIATDFARRDEQESRRVLHVGLTRAEELLVVCGRPAGDSTGDDRDIPHSFIRNCLDPQLGWTVGGVEFPVWEDLLQAMPPTAADWTETLAAEPSDSLRGEVIDGDETLSQAAARTNLIELGRRMVAGTLQADDGTGPIAIDRLREPAEASPVTRHSYTSLETFEECPRKHYLDHVVGAFADRTDNGPGSTGVSQREIGLVFHETAERAAIDGLESKDQWYDRCEQVATELDMANAVAPAKDCIDRFFDSPAATWEVIAAERQFSMQLDGHTVTGVIDAIARRPDGGLVVADYKATQVERDIDSSLQLPLYLIAANELFDLDIHTAAYVYVGEVGPRVDARSFEPDELDGLEDALIDELRTVEDATFDTYTTGPHCEWCPHRGLPCGQEYLEDC